MSTPTHTVTEIIQSNETSAEECVVCYHKFISGYQVETERKISKPENEEYTRSRICLHCAEALAHFILD